jgi:hypothetical protein
VAQQQQPSFDLENSFASAMEPGVSSSKTFLSPYSAISALA